MAAVLRPAHWPSFNSDPDETTLPGTGDTVIDMSFGYIFAASVGEARQMIRRGSA